MLLLTYWSHWLSNLFGWFEQQPHPQLDVLLVLSSYSQLQVVSTPQDNDLRMVLVYHCIHCWVDEDRMFRPKVVWNESIQTLRIHTTIYLRRSCTRASSSWRIRVPYKPLRQSVASPVHNQLPTQTSWPKSANLTTLKPAVRRMLSGWNKKSLNQRIIFKYLPSGPDE